MGEYIISLAIFAIISVILIGIGISQIRSKEAVGFFDVVSQLFEKKIL